VRLPATARGASLEAFGRTDWGLLTGIALIWGSSFVLIEIGLRALSPAVIAMSRVALGAAALALVPQARRMRIERQDRRSIVLLGFTWIGIPLLLFPIAQQWISSSLAGMFNGSMPLATAAWTIALTRRTPGRSQVVGLVLGFAGIVAITLPELPEGALSQDRAFLGVMLALSAAILYGLAANLAVPLQQRYGALPVMLRTQVVGLAVVTPFGLWGLRSSSFAWPSVLAMVPLGVLGTGVAFVMMATLVGRVGGPRGALAIYFVPLVAIVLGVTILGERIAPSALVGMGLVLVGAWLTSRRESGTTDSPRIERIERPPTGTVA